MLVGQSFPESLLYEYWEQQELERHHLIEIDFNRPFL